MLVEWVNCSSEPPARNPLNVGCFSLFEFKGEEQHLSWSMSFLDSYFISDIFQAYTMGPYTGPYTMDPYSIMAGADRWGSTSEWSYVFVVRQSPTMTTALSIHFLFFCVGNSTGKTAFLRKYNLMSEFLLKKIDISEQFLQVSFIFLLKYVHLLEKLSLFWISLIFFLR